MLHAGLPVQVTRANAPALNFSHGVICGAPQQDAILPARRREHAPSIIFMDEVDSIGSARSESGGSGGGGGDSEVQRTMLELLNQLDGFEATNKIKVRARAFRLGLGHVAGVSRIRARLAWRLVQGPQHFAKLCVCGGPRCAHRFRATGAAL